LKSAVIGLGETGRPLFEILQEAYPDIIGWDCDANKMKGIKHTVLDKGRKLDIINICIPYSDTFLDVVNERVLATGASLVIIHSTVPIGTTSKIRNAVHSPILGRHGRMKEDLKWFPKWIGGEKADEALNYLVKAGFYCAAPTEEKSETTEALKLMCLAKYGMSIAFAQYQQEICKKYNFPYEKVKIWDELYNANIKGNIKRPILDPPNGKIGGHCVIQNTKILNEQHPNKILEEILRYA